MIYSATVRCGLALALFPVFAAAVLADEGDNWPREIQKPAALTVMYQPQLDRLEGDEIYGRAAVSVTPTGETEPVFGSVWLEARIATDFDARTVDLQQLRIPQVRFPEATPEQEKQLTDLLMDEIPEWDLEMTLDRLLALTEVADVRTRASEGFDDQPPKIIFAQEPTVLVSIDGEPRLRDLEGSDGVKHVINTPFLLIEDPKKKELYWLYAGAETWYKSPEIEGPWSFDKKAPKRIRQLEPEDEEIEDEDDDKAPSTPPAIMVVTEPTELIVTEGAPEYKPIAGGKLLYVDNTESDILLEVESQRTFVLLSGRWFSSAGTGGPWQFVANDALPESFAEIDPDSDEGYLLTWVAGTDLAREAALDAAVPQTAAIRRDATITVTYDGEPQFEPIEGTTLQYAVNTESQVIQAGTTYYCAEGGAWYKAGSAKGPWSVATEIPVEFQKIPPSSPVYNTTFVEIYDSTPEVVYVGYYPGYTSSYVYHGCLVYGTGWYYRPWWGPYRYYPHHSTWGFHVRWNPWYGWSFGFSYSTGRFTFGIGWGGYRRGWWGPGGWRGYRHGYHRGWHRGYSAGRRAGYRSGYRAGQRNAARNIYQQPRNANRVASQARAGGGRTPTAAAGRSNNVFADKNGNIHRQQPDGSWQSRQDGQWRDSAAAGAGGAGAEAAADRRASTTTGDRQLPTTTPSERPSTATTQRQPTTTSPRQPTTTSQPTTTRSTYPSSYTSSLNRDAQARQRGSQRSQSYSSTGGMRGGGGRGGGGRR